jgi:hypothetical protein
MWVVVASVETVLPSPKFHSYLLASILHEELKFTFCPTVPVVGTSQQAIGFFMQLAKARVAINNILNNLILVFIFCN